MADGPTLIELPVEGPGGGNHPLFGSDLLAETIRALGIEWIALNPGASFRGLHDSLVNHLGNRDRQMLLCLHEEHAIRDPDPDLAVLARGFGVAGFGPAATMGALEAALHLAVAVVEGGQPALVDARVLPGYAPSMAAAMTRAGAEQD